jgi:hypothetical protein
MNCSFESPHLNPLPKNGERRKTHTLTGFNSQRRSFLWLALSAGSNASRILGYVAIVRFNFSVGSQQSPLPFPKGEDQGEEIIRPIIIQNPIGLKIDVKDANGSCNRN